MICTAYRSSLMKLILWPAAFLLLTLLASCDSGSGSADNIDLCPNDPATMPDEFGFCGNTGVSKTVTTGEALTLAVNGALLSIPADALEPGTIVTLTEVDPATLDSQPNGAGETRITPVYSLTFSTVQLVTEDLSFVLDIPTSVNARWDAHLKTEGGLATEEQSDVDWRITFGDYDEQQSSLLIELGATADRYLIAGVSGEAVTSSLATGASISASARPESMTARAATANLIIPDSDAPEWSAHGWVIFCVPADFAKFNNTKCSPSSPDFFDMMTGLGAKLYAVDQQLTTMGFPVGEMNFINEKGIALSKGEHLIYDPDNRSATTSSIGGFSPHYFVAFVDPNITDSALGLYFPSRKEIVVDIGSPDTIVIHELMHAVQFQRIPNTWGRSWIREALASAAMPFAPSSSVTNGEDFRYFDRWRDWKYPLNSEIATDAYRAAEYWLSWDGSLGSLSDLYDEIGLSRVNDTNEYDFIDESQLNVGAASLRDAYLNLIQSRNDDAEYPYCLGGTFACTGPSCSTTVSDFVPMSAECIDLSVDFTDACEGEPVDISVALEPSETNSNMKLMVDGIIYGANTEVPFEGDARLWAINTDYSQVINAPTAEIVFRNKAECGNPYITIVEQHISTSASARAQQDTNFSIIQPSLDGFGQGYTSLDVHPSGGSPRGTITTTTTSGDTVVDVEPLGLNAWQAAADGAAVFQSVDGGPVYNATASSSVSTDAKSDSASMTIMGEHFASAGPNSGNSSYAYARSSNRYVYEFGAVPVEFTLNWGCDLSTVEIYTFGGAEGFKSLYRADNQIQPAINNWECEPKIWMLPPETGLDIRIYTYYDDSTNPDNISFQNGGGAFEIKLQAILPE